jgi:hypothetical protein
MKRTKRTLGILMAMLLAVYLLPACSTDDESGLVDPVDPVGAPELPPMSTMVFNVDFFDIEMPEVSQSSMETGKPGEELQMADAANRANFINAFVRAVFVHLLMFDALEEPIGAFAYAIHSVPQKQDDGSWLWTYIFVDNALEYSVFLYGTAGPGNEYVDWRLEVSTNNPDLPLDHFVWFDGRAYTDDNHGHWQFYDPVLDPPAMASSPATDGVETVRIEWQNPSRTEHRLRIDINGEGHPEEGDYLEFFESSFRATIDHYDASERLESNITFYADGSGSLTVPDYNDGVTGCWDTEQKDTDCPE